MSSSIKTRYVGKHFRIVETNSNVLGKGGFGVVWLGHDNRDDTEVAVKQVERKPETERFCERELQFMQRCHHPNIVKLIAFDMQDGSLFFILELCPKGNLSDFVKDKDINFRVCLGYMLDITSGVQFMHGKKIGHRDIKPANVLVKDDKCVKLADFGLSRDLTDSTSASATADIGSIPWMAPEVPIVKSAETPTDEDAPRHVYGLAIDIFSLGLLFLSLILHRPGRHLTAHIEDNLWLGLWLNVKKDEQKPDIMHETDDKYTRVLKEFILEMLSYTPDVRPKITQVFQHIGHQIMQVKQEKSITKASMKAHTSDEEGEEEDNERPKEPAQRQEAGAAVTEPRK